MSSKRHRDGSIGPANAARDERGHQEIAAAAAVLFGNGDARVALPGRSLPHPARKIVAALNFRVMRANLVTRKVKGALISSPMLFREFKVHTAPPVLSGNANKANDLLLKVVYSLEIQDSKGRRDCPYGIDEHCFYHLLRVYLGREIVSKL